MKHLITIFSLLITHIMAISQPIDYTNCPSCSTEDIEEVKEINTKYLGVKGHNPSVPGTFNMIGKRKFSGTDDGLRNDGWGLLTPLFGNNWYPIKTKKQIFRGKFDHYAVNTWGDESDWCIYLLPATGFEDFISSALPYQGLLDDGWPKTRNGAYCVEGEITPPHAKYGNLWFNNSNHLTFPHDYWFANNYLLGKDICVYGAFVREESHGNHPEIHPSEQIWWKENDHVTNILLVGDGSNRFDNLGDYNTENALSGFKAWAPSTNLEAELKIPFKLTPSKEAQYFNITAIDDYNFYTGANYPDASAGTSHKIVFAGKTVLTVNEPLAYDQKIGITFSNVCFNRANGLLQGFIIIKSATGNGRGNEGFVLLQIARKETRFGQKPVLKWGNLLNSWEIFNPKYDNSIYFESIISSDKTGKGIVDGIIDFNGNGVTDLFIVSGGDWMVLYDGKGEWKKINRSHIPVHELRFGDINGDKKTDVLVSNLSDDVLISYEGTTPWQKLTEAPKRGGINTVSAKTNWTEFWEFPTITRDINVADFNGDGKTDIFFLEYHSTDKADMYVKYNCSGDWIRLNENYNLKYGDFDKYFRLGHFNRDNKTDILRYDNNRFLVYWGGKGNYEVLNNELPAGGLKFSSLLFAHNLSAPGLTDIISIDTDNKKWTTYYGGKPGTIPMPMSFNNPDKIHFGNVKNSAGWEAFVMDYISETGFAEPVDFPDVLKAETASFVVAEYKPGSLKKITNAGVSSFAYDMELFYHPGTNTTNNALADYSSINQIKEKLGKTDLIFKPGQRVTDQKRLLGTIEAVKLDSKEENEIEVIFSNNTRKKKMVAPAYSIGALATGIKETTDGNGNWSKWLPYLSKNSKTPGISIDAENNPPGKIEKIKTVSLELIPFYSSLERGKVSMAEMGAPMQELNEIVYGTDKVKITGFYGSEKVFNIKWNYDLKNLSSNKIETEQTNKLSVSSSKWANNKIMFTYPETDDLLQLTITANITDAMGVVSVRPIEMIYYNQRIVVTKDEALMKNWINSLGNTKGKDLLLKKVAYMAEDSMITLPEILSLFK